MPMLGYKEKTDGLEWQYRYNEVYPALPTPGNEEEGKGI